MKNYSIRRFVPQDHENWNAFIAKASNATFLFDRKYMEYHSDRFTDYSLIVFENDKWIAVLPANLNNNEVYSHAGLTYGGLVYNSKMKLSKVVGILREILKFLFDNKITRLHLKMMPSIYTDSLSEELAYALFPAEAKLVRRDALSVIDRSQLYKPSKDRLKCIARGVKNGLEIKEESAFELFWNEILIPNISRKHRVKPVHTFKEMEKLNQSFPANIRHFNVYHKGKIVAGTTIYVTKHVIHPQYISGQENKNELGSLDFLYDYLINDIFPDYEYFDFGISNESKGKKINEGLLFWKESFGTGTITQDFYEVETSNYELLNDVMI